MSSASDTGPRLYRFAPCVCPPTSPSFGSVPPLDNRITDESAQGPLLVKRYAYPSLAFGILGGYLLSRSEYIWAAIALVVCVVLMAGSFVIAQGERELARRAVKQKRRRSSR